MFNISEIKRILDNAEWDVDPAPVDDDDPVHSALYYLNNERFSPLAIKTAIDIELMTDQDDGPETDLEMAERISNAIAWSRIDARNMAPKFGINRQKDYFSVII